MEMQNVRKMIIPVALVALLLGLGSAGEVSSEVKLLKGQTVYVLAYSHIYHGDREQPFLLAVTLSVRNTDPDHPITLTTVDYYDSDGKLLKSYLDKEMKLGAMASIRYVVKESDKSGGVRSQFPCPFSLSAIIVLPAVLAGLERHKPAHSLECADA
jgi:hypothetical protein